MKIGVFDSGLGGLVIFKALIKILPQYDYIYFGDNAHVPYGGRSNQLIYQFTKYAVNSLFKKNCQLVILACNTASATTLRRIQQEYLPKKYSQRRVLGVIKPTIEKVAELKINQIGVMGTYATVSSGAFVREIKKVFPKSKVVQQACPLLVPIIEEGEWDWVGLKLILKKYLLPFKKNKIKSLILGCTHYGLIADKIQAVVGKKVKIISQGKETAEKLKDYLKRHPEIEKKLTKNRQIEYWVTDLNEKYKKMAERFLGQKINFKLHPTF